MLISQPALSRSIQKLKIEELFEKELLLLPPEHPLVAKPKIRLSDVEPLPFVLLGKAHCLSENNMSFCCQRLLQPVTVERTSQLAMVQELVSLSRGVPMLPAMVSVLDNSDRRVYRSLSDKHPCERLQWPGIRIGFKAD